MAKKSTNPLARKKASKGKKATRKTAKRKTTRTSAPVA